MIQRFVTTLFAVGVVFAVACIDMSAPRAAAFISVLQLPSPAVVVGDTLRDSLGNVVPLKVLVYDGSNNQIPDVPAQFFFNDTTTAARLTPQNAVVGNTIGTVHLVGQVGNLQTPVAVLYVTHLPAAIVPNPPPPTAAEFDVLADSTGSYGYSTITVRVRSAADSGSQGIIVRYKIVSAPATRGGVTVPAVSIVTEDNKPASADTTDANGSATRKLAVFPRSLADVALAAGTKVDTALVEVSASHKGVALASSPLRFFIQLKSK